MILENHDILNIYKINILYHDLSNMVVLIRDCGSSDIQPPRSEYFRCRELLPANRRMLKQKKAIVEVVKRTRARVLDQVRGDGGLD